MRFANVAHDGVGGALAGAGATTLTLGGFNAVGHEGLALLSAAGVLFHVLHIFVPEVVDSR